MLFRSVKFHVANNYVYTSASTAVIVRIQISQNSVVTEVMWKKFYTGYGIFSVNGQRMNFENRLTFDTALTKILRGWFYGPKLLDSVLWHGLWMQSS